LGDKEILNNYQPLRYVGSGTNGIAYFSGANNSIIKLTTDMDQLPRH